MIDEPHENGIKKSRYGNGIFGKTWNKLNAFDLPLGENFCVDKAYVGNPLGNAFG